MTYWLLGANWGGIDKTADFLAEDYWANGYEDKFSDQVKAVQAGDRVAIKASYTRRQNLPFDNHGLTVSCMDIKATGTVRGNPGDGKILYIDWDEDFEPRTIYLFNHWRTINRLDRGKWARVIDYIFGKAGQPLSELEAMYAERARQQHAREEESSAVISEPSALPVADNIIYYGPPGCGKTWQLLQAPVAGAPVHIEMVSFHPSMSYEEFVEGLRPVVVKGALSYEVVPGIFRRLCQQAEANPEEYFRLVIDEINRADISRVLGELISLIEPDKRAGQPNAAQVRLPYSRALFTVPPNLCICGTMNAVDRSITLMDMALRRRFCFKRLAPDTALLARDVAGVNLQKLLAMLNARLEYLLGPEFVLGHGYFMAVQRLSDLQQLFKEQIIPLLEEYFYEDWAQLQQVLTDQNTGECHFIVAQSLDPTALFGPGGHAAPMTQPGRRYRLASTFSAAMFTGLYGE